ncbi:transcription elongation factor, mitochondrial isoform X1 [Palaemon carinicauda]|uniref:transcription elongation factor, mitochondrial isoform X1 n=1 Tax=Palaemon carinicauda TaxID=392227 RepID=UPI0035B58A8C
MWMSLYLTFPRKYLQHSAGVLSVLHNHGFFTEVLTRNYSKVYDLTRYEFTYSPEETHKILEILNHSSEEELFKLRITKGTAKKLIKGRSQLGSFKDVSQLMNIDGFGLKNIENICEKVLNEKPSETPQENKVQSRVVVLRRFVKPKVQPRILEMETLLALDVMIGGLSWTLLDRRGVLVDVGYEELLSKSQRLDAPKLYNKMVSVARRLPKADVYVWEERANYGYLQKAPIGSIIIAMKLAQMKGILTALLDVRQQEEEEGNLFYLRDLLVSKLFSLKVGEERVCGLKLADQIMLGEEVLNWLPPLILSNETQEKYFSIDKMQRKYISTSLFISLAFYHAIIHENILIQKILTEG